MICEWGETVAPAVSSVIYTDWARKRHTCCSCDKDILPTEPLYRYHGKYDGEWETYKLCTRCWDLRDEDIPFEAIWCHHLDHLDHLEMKN